MCPCYRTQVRLLNTQSQQFKRKVSVVRKTALIRNVSNLGRWWTYVQRPTSKFLLSHDNFLKGKIGGGRISVNHWSRELSSGSFTIESRLVGSAAIILPKWSVSRIAWGDYWELKASHFFFKLLNSSFLLLFIQQKNQQVRVWCAFKESLFRS